MIDRVPASRTETGDARRRWERLLEGALRSVAGPRAHALALRYRGAFGEAYRVVVPPDLAARDVADLEAMLASGAAWWVSFGRVTDEGGPTSVLKIFRRGERPPLSEIVPVLADCALTVLDETAHAVGAPGGAVFLHVLLVRTPDGLPVPPEAEARLVETVGAVLRGEIETDRLQGLIVAAGLTPREVRRVRALHGFFQQAGAAQTRRSVTRALLANPSVVRAILGLWDEKFDPARPSARRARAVESARRRVEEALAAVGTLEEDRILRAFFTIADAAVRTNEYLGGEAIAFKVDCEKIPWLRRPRPWREIYVDAPRMSGCHLRFGPVARGGIRWSDRPDDFRTEVLGLARTQVVKNAMIVPTGAKGVFVLKRPPRDRAALAAAGVEAYRTLVRSMLEITDDYNGGRVVPPRGVVRHDGDDPYLVVAADKGTATFSDTANALAAERGFWLGDAFASGGSKGYDHKIEGITAKGAWECVKRHFRDMGRDPERESFTVVGLGDMSGDVFGNGLLLMRRARLLAAFDHRHVFVDPNPDPERSWRERRRLFRLPRSSWADYAPRALSKGGGVYGRSEKAIRLSPEARAALGLGAAPTDGEALVRAVLAAEADLLWNGGIGTYVKATDEANAEVGDPANDLVRIDSSALRVKVVGEGGNLGFTQRARIEAARRGIRLNTDAVDNAGGVHLSDKEVNLKILLAGRRDRDRVLARVKREVVDLVIEANRAQALAISMDVARSRAALEDFAGMAADLERRGHLRRRAENLPDAEEMRDRRRAGEGLHRPEAAVLLALAKIDATRRILESPILTRPGMDRYVADYFPAPVVRLVGRRLGAHRLRDRLLACVLANRFVNHHGAAALWRLTTEMGLAASRVISASLRAEEVLGAQDLRADLAALEAAGGAGVLDDLFALEEAVLRSTRWIVRHGAGQASSSESPWGRAEGRAFDRLDRTFLSVRDRLLTPGARGRFEAAVASARARGRPRGVAERLAALGHMRTYLDIVDLARVHRENPLAVGRLLYDVGERLRFPAALDRLESLPAVGEWDRAAAAHLVTELRQARRRIVERVIAEFDGEIGRYLELRHRSFDTVRSSAARIEADADAGLAAFVVFSDQVNNLAAL